MSNTRVDTSLLQQINHNLYCLCIFQYLESVRPVLSEERFKEMEKLAVDFKV